MKNEERVFVAAMALTVAERILHQETLSLSDIRLALNHTRRATCALQAIECNLSGMPEPKSGE